MQLIDVLRRGLKRSGVHLAQPFQINAFVADVAADAVDDQEVREWNVVVGKGRAQKTIFMCQYLRDRELQREINSGLNVVEGWNDVNDVIFFGKSGELSSNHRDQHELAIGSLHVLQAALVYINTLMIQDALAEPQWADVLTPEDRLASTRCSPPI